MKFVKQNLISDLSDPVILKQRITAIQDEHERLLLLYNEFLVDKLTNAFNHPDPTQHGLFQHTQEMKPDNIYKTKEKVTKEKQVKELVSVLAKQYLLSMKDD
ncbi:21642_t:CDS:2 [Cetraspora pellucida]|uniref:21642_t:CDS:1 n=1 Tax=Cetraspora pellucida TaxID=1433469 RepID=A0A9N9N4A6_9GLOM|nr:21642_t:CDS:2 [Cetraspora pellucida]